MRLLLALSAVARFAGLVSVRFYETHGPALAIVCWTALAGLFIAYGAVRLVPSIHQAPGKIAWPDAQGAARFGAER